MKINRSTFLLLAVAILLSSVLACGSKQTPVIKSPEEKAWDACIVFIEKETGIPTADASEYGTGEITINSDGDYEVVVDYAKQKIQYQCTIMTSSNGDMNPYELQQLK